MSFPLEKYKFYVSPNENKVIAVSSYAGRKVTGVATCAPEDKFDLKKGMALAAARCNLKVAEKRMKRASQKREEADEILLAASEYLAKTKNYYGDACVAFDVACDELSDLLETM